MTSLIARKPFRFENSLTLFSRSSKEVNFPSNNRDSSMVPVSKRLKGIGQPICQWAQPAWRNSEFSTRGEKSPPSLVACSVQLQLVRTLAFRLIAACRTMSTATVPSHDVSPEACNDFSEDSAAKCRIPAFALAYCFQSVRRPIPKSYKFEFNNVETQYESYRGRNARLRYFVRVKILVNTRHRKLCFQF